MKTAKQFYQEKKKYSDEAMEGIDPQIIHILDEFANQSKWISVEDKNMPRFYENYLLSINGTVQYITYQFVGKEVDEKWIMDDSDPAYWFQAESDGQVHQVLIDDYVFYQPLPSPPKNNEHE